MGEARASNICCPSCGYDLRASTMAHGAVCPECGARFTAADIAELRRPDNPTAVPRSLNPHERRLRGCVVIVFGAIGIVLTIILIDLFW